MGVEPATLAVLLTFFGTIVSAAAALGAAFVINGREKRDSASKAAEKLDAREDEINEKRVVMHKERNALLSQENAELRIKLANAEARADRLQLAIDEIRAEEQEQIHE